MAGRFRPRSGLEKLVARMVEAKVRRLCEQVALEARHNAPPTKTWVTRGDERVRPEHAAAHGQTVPQNLRFVLDSPPYDQEHYRVGPKQQLRQPRDPSASPGLTANCRCEQEIDPRGLADRIDVEDVGVRGTQARGRVVSRGPRVADCEWGTDKDTPARYMGRALRTVARRLRR